MDAACRRTESCGRPTSSSASTCRASGASLKSPTIGAGTGGQSVSEWAEVWEVLERLTLEDVGAVDAQLVLAGADEGFETE